MGFFDPVSKADRDRAIIAVRNGVGDSTQQKQAAAAAQQAGSVGKNALKAFKGK